MPTAAVRRISAFDPAVRMASADCTSAVVLILLRNTVPIEIMKSIAQIFELSIPFSKIADFFLFTTFYPLKSTDYPLKSTDFLCKNKLGFARCSCVYTLFPIRCAAAAFRRNPSVVQLRFIAEGKERKMHPAAALYILAKARKASDNTRHARNIGCFSDGSEE